MNFQNYSFCKKTLISAVTIATLMASTKTFASLLEEVVVTAQKREQNLQDVGISITAFSGDQLDELGYKNTLELFAQTPNVTVSSFHTSLANINIRGVSQTDFSEQLEAPIAIYVDNAYVTSMGLASTQVFDLDRVEILRGPQGTLFGRNATGGLIHYISRKPTQEFEAFAELTVGEYGLTRFQGAISGPLSDTVSGRIAVSAHHDDGYLENRLGDDLRDNGVNSVRGLLSIDLSQDANLLLKAHYSDDDTNGNGYTAGASIKNPSTFGIPNDFPMDGLARFVPSDVDVYGTCEGCDLFGYRDADSDPHTESLGSQGFQNPRGNDPFFEREVSGASATLEIDYEGFTLVSITDFLAMRKAFREDSDGTPFFGALFETATDLDQFSQELKLSGGTDRLIWAAGLYYLNFTTDQFVDAPATLTFGTDASSILPYAVSTEGEIESESRAVFGHLQYQLNDELSITAGLRYTEDERKLRDHLNYDSFGNLLPAFGVEDASVSLNQTFPELASQDFENYSANLQFDWTPADDLLVYAGYTRGHKAGNFALPLGGYINAAFGDLSDLERMPHDEEVLHSYEIGLKWSSQSFSVNAAAFYYDYQDYQAFTFEGLSSQIGNIDAEVTGAELEVAFAPTDRLELRLGASFLNAEAQDFQRTLFLDPADQQLPYSPDYSLNGIARYQWPGFGGSFAAQADFNHVDAFCFTLVCHGVEEEDSYTIANLRLTYFAEDSSWSIAAFVNNVTDEEYRQFGLSLETVTTGINNAFAPPRWVGVTLRYDWN